ncbi:hypothetical protein NLI96_g11149 [Meripilus lineatus]|uniref:Extracellular membrane protein CFEM domain-containing protein n=1 Tax=Meripilus lineatus TaxID=2056292 RepID=A0AAD5USM7_9APHY|nr:hypothetical protein NLI96_g11149 [Physisporinus lineatus]
MRFLAVITILAAAVSQASATLTVSSNHARDVLVRRGSLYPRQNYLINPSLVPSQCQSQCADITNLQDCVDSSCLCTEKVNQGMASCMNCVLAIDGSPNPEEVDALQLTLTGDSNFELPIQEFEQACNSLGKSLAVLDLSGGDGSTLPSGISTPLATPSLTSASEGASSTSGGASPSTKSGGTSSIVVPVMGLAVTGLIGATAMTLQLW